MIRSFALVAVLALACVSAMAQTPAPGDLVINEIMYDPPVGGSGNEWIEVFNRSAQTFDLQGLIVADSRSQSDALAQSVSIAPGGYVVLASDASAFAAAYPGVAFVALDIPALNNSGDRPALLFGTTEIDAVPYEPSWGGSDASLERKDPAGPSSAAINWASASPAAGTPGAQNSQFDPDTDGPLLVSATGTVDGRAVIVTLDEPVDPASVSGAFTVSGATVTVATYDAGGPSVVLSLSAPLPTGTYTVTAMGLTDLLGNRRDQTSVSFDFEADETPPALTSATATSASVVEIRFSETVTASSAGDPANYSIDNGIGSPASVEVVVESGDARGARLTLFPVLQARVLYTLTVSGIEDLTGNQGGGAAQLFVGQADTPERGEIVVSEIMFDPQTGSDGEYIEIVNTTADRIFDLRQIAYNDDPITESLALLTPGQILAVVRDAEAFRATFPAAPFLEADDFDGLSNSGDTVVLSAGGAVIDSLVYDPDWHRPELDDATGIALERRDLGGDPNDSANWTSSLDESGGTPGRANSVGATPTPPPDGTGIETPPPFAPDDGEAARIVYTLAADAALVRVRIYDSGGRFVREIEAGRLSGREGSVLWDGRGENGERLRVGLYVVLLEAVDAGGGTTEAHKGTVVIGRR